MQTFQPYVIKNMDFQAVYFQRVDDYLIPPAVEADRILDVMHSREFRNILTQKHTISSDLLAQHRDLRIQTDRVIAILRAEIGDAVEAQ